MLEIFSLLVLMNKFNPLVLSLTLHSRYYNDILQVLSNAIGKETYGCARDNILGAIARMITANHAIIPLDSVFPVFVNQLPLKVDMAENKSVFRCVLTLYAAGHTVLQPHLQTLLAVAINVLKEDGLEEEGNFLNFSRILEKLGH